MCDDFVSFFHMVAVLQHVNASIPNNDISYYGKCGLKKLSAAKYFFKDHPLRLAS